jgi:hypothetical protein
LKLFFRFACLSVLPPLFQSTLIPVFFLPFVVTSVAGCKGRKKSNNAKLSDAFICV